MKKSSLFVIAIPLTIAGLVIAGVVILRVMSAAPAASPESSLPANTVPAPLPSLSATAGKPTVGFGSLQSANPVADLRQQFDASADDGGVASMDALQKQANSL